MAKHQLQAPWMAAAWADFGEREIDGRAANPRILAYYRDIGHPDVTSDEVAWCAAFLGAVLERSGVQSTRSLRARSYLDWGAPLDEPVPGAIAVLTRGSDPNAGHVGFIVGATESRLFLLGGNQSDAVTVMPFDRGRLLSIRWPLSGAAKAPSTTTAPVGDLFELALAHVLEMEGGWTDDPFDPGGPTNFGITLATYAAYVGRPLDASSAASLTFELKTIKPELVARIYRERYWAPSRAYEMPPAVALMHFDASVNHGLTGAAKLLQQAVDVEVDGEIGPITMGAVARAAPGELIARYAEVRRQRYRALPHFWRFGRGWLNRVDRTLAAASRLVGETRAPRPAPATSRPASRSDPTTPTQASEAPMIPSPTTTDRQPKWWGRSLTIWGVIVTTLATVLPAIGPLIGIDITAEMVRELGDHVTRVVQAIGGLVGVVMTIVGRVRAAQPLARRDVRIRL